MSNGKTVEEARAMKRDLELKISEELQAYEQATGVIVTNISLERYSARNVAGTVVCGPVTTKLEVHL